ncbi:MAG: putative ATP-binding protein transporter protein [Devosia sp.]|uniref:ABC transporter ATP-binding protein n=1 Tax=Devosia sp. TaxID=1871048 RepID=UPI002633A750|nr:sn-glycerol-3-phosphate ABC transporter ATP-binding protein UgpC [Devosia sp.]MDB5587135.1 putative ATP-binding protein transporter protein [Devosia sp.]
MANVVLSNVSKSYGNLEVIEGLNLAIKDGSFTVFVGPSGCGKSTLLRMIAGLEPITKGTLEIDGKPMNEADPIERGVAMVFQNYALYPHMSVEQNIGFSLRMAGLSKEDIAARVAVAAQTLQIEPLLKRKPGQLSGGQRQRVAIGRAIVRDPEVFLFDEPLSNLDAELRVSMRVEIAKLHNTLGSTMIYVTHDQTEAMTLADKIVVMRAGKIEQAGTPEELYDNPDNLFVAGFIGSPRMNFLRGAFGGGRLRLETGAEWAGAVPDGAVLVGVRPEHFVEPGHGAADVSVKVDVVENLGGTRFVYGTLGSGESVVVEARERGGIRAGDQISFGIKPERAMLFSPSGTRLRNL